MNIEHLKYLIVVEEYGSISKAAEHLFMNQPHLSKIIKKYEDEMHLKIFERTSQGVVPTKQGREFLKQAKDIVILANRLEEFYKPKHDRIVRLKVCVPRASYVSQAFVDFLKNHDLSKGVDVDYLETNTMQCIEKVCREDYGFGIIRFPIDDQVNYKELLSLKGLESINLFVFRYLVLMSKDNPLADKTITRELLDQQIELLHGDIYVQGVPFAYTNHLHDKANQKMCIYERGSQFEILDNIPNSYMWVSPMPQRILDKLQLVQKECADVETKCIDLIIYKKGHIFTELDNEFIEGLKKYCKEV